MYKNIYKYPLDLKPRQTIKVPEIFDPLAVQLQNGAICLWARVDPESRPREIEIIMHGTGTGLEEELQGADCRHLGTVQTGQWVWHFFMASD